MALAGRTEWKEILIVTDEDDQSFVFSCGWGVEPPVAYITSAADWRRCVPPWLADRRDEVIAVMRHHKHVVDEGPYPDWRRFL